MQSLSLFSTTLHIIVGKVLTIKESFIIKYWQYKGPNCENAKDCNEFSKLNFTHYGVALISIEGNKLLITSQNYQLKTLIFSITPSIPIFDISNCTLYSAFAFKCSIVISNFP